MDRVYAPWRSKYFALNKRGGCLFCEVQKEANDDMVGILKRGEHWYVILNMYPYTSGHLMLVSARHIERMGEVTDEEGAELLKLLAACESALEDAYKPDGMNIGVNRGSSAGAGVRGHLHFHICPRWEGDTNFMTSLAETRVVSEDLAESYHKLAPGFRD